jgi:hypothetical protein
MVFIESKNLITYLMHNPNLDRMIFQNLVALFFPKVFFNADRSYGRCQVEC